VTQAEVEREKQAFRTRGAEEAPANIDTATGTSPMHSSSNYRFDSDPNSIRLLNAPLCNGAANDAAAGRMIASAGRAVELQVLNNYSLNSPRFTSIHLHSPQCTSVDLFSHHRPSKRFNTPS